MSYDSDAEEIVFYSYAEGISLEGIAKRRMKSG
jgi:hypothetical protein